ncbi:MAG: serine/threonine-protein kinase [Anaerolineales bacterium]|nr:MAG: serine/threonine-protein kinase [Anaerolineales bacterium]
MIGKVIKGTYRILEELGRGTVSTAYLARDTAHERRVALKVIHPDLSRESQFTSRFAREGKLLAKLDSPHMVRVLDFGTDEGLDYIVMEYVEGRALSTVLEQVGTFGVKRALGIIRQVVQGLEDAHDRGVVHRDIRPSNVMVAADGVVSVMDFGLAAGTDLNRLSASGVVGTPHYLAPEWVAEGREADIRADIYSLGVTLFEMLTGQRPYEADSAADIVKKHLQEPVPSARQLNQEIPAEVDDLVRKCLAKEPRNRFQTPTELLRAIDEALEEEESGPGLERLLTGRTLGQCRLLEQLGSGGMATVYKAYQPSLDRYVAVKVLPPFLASTPDFITRFRREARAIARLNHPNILPVYDSGQEGELSYIVMRYVEGGTLQETLGKPLPLDRVVEMITQVGGALDYAHREGIIHRDVKPSNVLMDKREWALLSDFGLAKVVETSVQLTKTGAGLGTPAYIAPELGKGEPVDERSDIYSLGIVLYEMLTGRVPFEAETPMAVVMEHISTPLPMPRSINPDIPEPVEQVVLKALAKDPADRFQRMREMVAALQKAVAGEPGMTIAIPPAVGERPPKAEAIAEEGERIGVPPIEKEKALKVKGVSLKALLLRGALIAVPILILVAFGWVVVSRLGKEPGPQPLAVHLTPVPTAPGSLDVVLGFGNIWHGRSDVQNHLGQPVTPQQGIPYAHQFFVTGGYLFERLDTHQIYVLYPTNEWEVYEDKWQEGEDVGDLTPPSGVYVPTEGFGKLWRESPAVRSGLDWGSSPGITGIDGAVQQFERGLMLFNGLESKQIYVLYITPDSQYRWLVLPDSWRPPPGILFVSDRDGDDEIWVMQDDGSEQIPLTVNTWLDGCPAWSCGGSRIAYTVAEPGGEEDIMIMKNDTSGKTGLTANPTVRDTDPAWSPDDSRMAFVSYRDGNAEIYVTKMDGSDPINLTDNPADDWDPAWSPDGSMIAFTSDRDGNPEIYVMNSRDGQNLRRLTENETIDEQPAWWQDATSDRIAFVSYRDGNAEIYLMDSDGSHPVNLTNNVAEDKRPTWSLDGSQIAFTSNRDGDREIFVMGADGSHPTNLTDNSVDDWDPHWGR